MLNLVIGLLLGGCIAAVILCCIQISRVGRCEVSVNDMRLRILKLTEFTPENASHFPKMGGEGN